MPVLLVEISAFCQRTADSFLRSKPWEDIGEKPRNLRDVRRVSYLAGEIETYLVQWVAADGKGDCR